MIDRFRRLANSIRILAPVLLLLALGCTGVALFVVFGPVSQQADKYLFPAIVGLLWSLAGYGFIETFRHVPANLGRQSGLALRLRRRLVRLWYWLVALVLVGTTAVVAFLTLRMLTIWLRDFAGR